MHTVVTYPLFVFLLLLISVSQYWFMIVFTPRQAIGDELAYLKRGQQKDPHQPSDFLRVPFYSALSKWITKTFVDPEAAWRWINSIFAILAAAATMLAALQIGGNAALCLSALLLLLLPERLIFSAHIWPENLLSLYHALLLLLLIQPISLISSAAIGLLTAFAVMTRIEQLFLLPATLLALLLIHDDIDSIILLLTLIPPLATLLVWSFITRRRYQIWWPDTTWMFNLRLLGKESGQSTNQTLSIDPIIDDLYLDWQDLKPEQQSTELFTWMYTKPGKLLYLISARILAFWGPDTFISHKMLPPSGKAYPYMESATSKRLVTYLKWSFPVISLFCFWAIIRLDAWHYYLLPGTVLFFVLIFTPFRTRFRQMIIPWLVVAGATGTAQTNIDTIALADWLLLAGLMASVWWLANKPRRIELSVDDV